MHLYYEFVFIREKISQTLGANIFKQLSVQTKHNRAFISFTYRSIKHDHFWLHLREKGEMSVFEFLENAFDTDNYINAVQRALTIPTCRIVPYYDIFVQILKTSISNEYRNFVDSIMLPERSPCNKTFEVWKEEVKKVLPSDIHFNTKLLEPLRREKHIFRSTNADAHTAVEKLLALKQHQSELGKKVPQNMLDYLR